jgi:hypothetical protein
MCVGSLDHLDKLQVLLKKTVNLTTINQSSNFIDESTKQDYKGYLDWLLKQQKCVYIISLIIITFYSISFYNKCMEHSHRLRYAGCENWLVGV